MILKYIYKSIDLKKKNVYRLEKVQANCFVLNEMKLAAIG